MIDQKAREIAEQAHAEWAANDYTEDNRRIIAARLGIIEGLEMADQKLKVLMLGLPMNGPKAQALLAASAAIHALIGEKI